MEQKLGHTTELDKENCNYNSKHPVCSINTSTIKSIYLDEEENSPFFRQLANLSDREKKILSHFLTYRVLQLGDRGSPVLNVPIQKSEVESVIQSMLDYSSSAEDFCYSLLCDRLGFVKVQLLDQWNFKLRGTSKTRGFIRAFKRLGIHEIECETVFGSKNGLSESDSESGSESDSESENQLEFSIPQIPRIERMSVNIRRRCSLHPIPDFSRLSVSQTRHSIRQSGSISRISLDKSLATHLSRRSTILPRPSLLPSCITEENEEHPVLNISSVVVKESDNSDLTIYSVLKHVLCFLDQFDLNTCSIVSKKWREVALIEIAEKIAESQFEDISDNWIDMCAIFPIGKYLSDGCYKSVYCVWNSWQDRWDAVSVMNMVDIIDSGNQHVLSKELKCTFLVDLLRQEQGCPNFLQVYQVMTLKYPPPSSWGNSKHKNPNSITSLTDPPTIPRYIRKNKANQSSGKFQYIRIELCEGGDIESHMRLLENKSFEIHQALWLFFQMIYSVYLVQKHLKLRHYDLKLLNFLLKKPLDAESPFDYQFESKHFICPVEFQEDRSSWIVKLADFGTSDLDLSTIDCPITLNQITTLENTPIDFLVLGNTAKQNMAADMFALGLCLLHLATGVGPYEEIMEDLHCPARLRSSLYSVWSADPDFDFLVPVVDQDPEFILGDTVYRILCLVGVPSEEEFPQWYQKSIGQVISRYLKTKSGNSRFLKDREEYSLEFGQLPLLVEARNRLSFIPNGLTTLKSLLSPNPSNFSNLIKRRKNF